MLGGKFFFFLYRVFGASARELAAVVLLFSFFFVTAGVPQLARAASPAPAQAEKGMVVTSQADAARAGQWILMRGGNAVDAAVATAYAMSVVQPFSSGLGGGGFILIRRADGKVIAIDARETAPAAASRGMYTAKGVPDRASISGPLAIATPGLVAGLALALDQHGTMSLAEVLKPAILLARDGFEIGPYHARMLEIMRPHLTAKRFPETARIQFPPEGEEVRVGWRLVQSDLAKTLGKLSHWGVKSFYHGSIGKAISDHVQKAGGILNQGDLAEYRPIVREAVKGSYRGIEVHSFPPPSSGGVVLLEVLNTLEGFDLKKKGEGSSSSLHVIAEAMKLAFADRAAYMGDPDFVDIPVKKLISKEYGAAQYARINPEWFERPPWRWFSRKQTIRVREPGLASDDAGTAHISVVDAKGNAVALTKTINTPFGSGITVPGTGIVLNNEMDDFAVAPDTPNSYGLVDTRGANAIAPRKRPLSSMSPTILVKDGKPLMVTGSPGGPRIITTTLLTILNVVDYEMNVQAAVGSPRFHHQWIPDKLFVEPEIPVDVVRALERKGHVVERSKRHWSAAQAIVIDPATGILYGGSDPRSDGVALGY